MEESRAGPVCKSTQKEKWRESMHKKQKEERTQEPGEKKMKEEIKEYKGVRKCGRGPRLGKLNKSMK